MDEDRGRSLVVQRGPIGFPLAIYALYLLAFVTGGATWLVAIVMAYLGRADAPAWQQGHFRFQIRTFWMGLLFGLIAGVTAFVFVGFVLGALVAVWLVVRCVKGILWLQKGEDVPDPESWLFGERKA